MPAPIYNLVSRPAKRTIFPDASKRAIGGYCLEAGCIVLEVWTSEGRTGKISWIEPGRNINDISINALELLGVVISVLVVSCEDLPT